MGGAWTNYEFEGKSLVRPVLIETGTYQGENVDRALAAGFGHVHTIEVSEKWATLAKEKYKDEPRVTVHHGSSRDLLLGVCEGVKDQSVTIYLDGHFQGYPNTPDEWDGVSECPVLAELAAITTVAWTVPPWVVIDDAHLFVAWDRQYDDEIAAKGLTPTHWPSLARIRAAVHGHRVVLDDDRLFVIPVGV